MSKKKKNKYNFHESGKTHDKTKHISKKYYEELDRIFKDHEHTFNPSTGLCVHCLLHKDKLLPITKTTKHLNLRKKE